MPPAGRRARRHGQVNRLTLRDLLQFPRHPPPASLDGKGRDRPASPRRTRNPRRRPPRNPRSRTRQKTPPSRRTASHDTTARVRAIGRRLPQRSRSAPLRGASSARPRKRLPVRTARFLRTARIHGRSSLDGQGLNQARSQRARSQQAQPLTSTVSMRLAAATSRSAMSRRRRSPSRSSSHGMYSRASTSAHVGGENPFEIRAARNDPTAMLLPIRENAFDRNQLGTRSGRRVAPHCAGQRQRIDEVDGDVPAEIQV